MNSLRYLVVGALVGPAIVLSVRDLWSKRRMSRGVVRATANVSR